MSTDKMREEFEAWATKQGLNLKKIITGVYRTGNTSLAWKSWIASRAALVVELPAEVNREYFNDESMSNGYNYGVDDCRETIEAAGVMVK